MIPWLFILLILGEAHATSNTTDDDKPTSSSLELQFHVGAKEDFTIIPKSSGDMNLTLEIDNKNWQICTNNSTNSLSLHLVPYQGPCSFNNKSKYNISFLRNEDQIEIQVANSSNVTRTSSSNHSLVFVLRGDLKLVYHQQKDKPSETGGAESNTATASLPSWAVGLIIIILLALLLSLVLNVVMMYHFLSNKKKGDQHNKFKEQDDNEQTTPKPPVIPRRQTSPSISIQQPNLDGYHDERHNTNYAQMNQYPTRVNTNSQDEAYEIMGPDSDIQDNYLSYNDIHSVNVAKAIELQQTGDIGKVTHTEWQDTNRQPKVTDQQDFEPGEYITIGPKRNNDENEPLYCNITI